METISNGEAGASVRAKLNRMLQSRVAPEQFGAVGDGVADDTAAWNAAIATGFPIRGTAGATYRTTATLDIAGACDIDLTGATIACDTGNDIIVATNTGNIDMKTLAASYTPGALSITVNALATAPVPGSSIKIVAQGAVDPANRAQGSESDYPMGEWLSVGIGSTTTNIVLTQPVQWAYEADGTQAYTTGNGARLIVLSPEPLRIVNGTIKHVSGTAGGGIVVRGYIQPKIDVNITKCNDVGVGLHGCDGAVVRGNISADTYGVGDRATRNSDIDIRGSMIGDGRHVYTTISNTYGTSLNTLIGVGRTQGARVRGWAQGGAIVEAWDTHHDADDITFDGVVTQGGAHGAIKARGRDVTFIAPRGTGGTGFGIVAMTEYDSGDGEVWVAGAAPEFYTSCTVIDADMDRFSKAVEVNHAFLTLGGTGRHITRHPQCVWTQGGQVTIQGHQTFTVLDGDSTTGQGLISLIAASADSAMPETELVIESGAVVTIDARLANDGSVVGLSVPDDTNLYVRGTLILRLPAGATYRSGTGVIRCQDKGLIKVSIEGASDATLFSDRSTIKYHNVETFDGSFRWDDRNEGAGLSVDDGKAYLPSGIYAGSGAGSTASTFPNNSARYMPFLNLVRDKGSNVLNLARVFFDTAGVPSVAVSEDTAGTWTTANRLYGTANTVGLISNGGLIEFGETATGSWELFADGTLKCWTDNFQTVVNDAAAWYFPADFSGSFMRSTFCAQQPSSTRYNIWASFEASDRVSIRSSNTANSENVAPICSILTIGRAA